MATKTIDTWQSVIGFVGITLGAIPLVATIFGWGRGMWGLVLDDSAGMLLWLCPLVVTVVGVGAIGELERRKRRAR
ncbi:hypothetical protein [Nocardia australiensis]|uniref:hypothetical protein n=1 Tax=Nocardia australiensis TaxID=2887191 RepID=UPI001D144E05|nr:hypothetical protein [Nocardia australiensis]